MPGTPEGKGRKNVRGHAGRRRRRRRSPHENVDASSPAAQSRRRTVSAERRDAANALPNKSAAGGEGTEGRVEEEEGEREGVLSKRHYTVYALVTELLRVIGAARPLAGCCSAPLINSIINATMCVALLR